MASGVKYLFCCGRSALKLFILLYICLTLPKGMHTYFYKLLYPFLNEIINVNMREYLEFTL